MDIKTLQAKVSTSEIDTVLVVFGLDKAGLA